MAGDPLIPDNVAPTAPKQGLFDAHNDLGGPVTTQETAETIDTTRRGLGRRTVLKGAAWSAPAVLAVGVTMPVAASPVTAVTISGPPYINLSNKDDVPLTGTGPASSTITVTAGNVSQTVESGSDGAWSRSFNASGLDDAANIVFTASAGSSSGTAQITKDTAAPVPTIRATGTYSPSGETFTVTGTMGTADATTADSQTGTLSGGPGGPVTVSRTGSGAWSHTFTGVQENPGSGNTAALSLTLTQSDGAGNEGTSGATSVSG